MMNVKFRHADNCPIQTEFGMAFFEFSSHYSKDIAVALVQDWFIRRNIDPSMYSITKNGSKVHFKSHDAFIIAKMMQ